eukprot:336025-Pelagomonas_calceolata.AAC.5
MEDAGCCWHPCRAISLHTVDASVALEQGPCKEYTLSRDHVRAIPYEQGPCQEIIALEQGPCNDITQEYTLARQGPKSKGGSLTSLTKTDCTKIASVDLCKQAA